MTKEQKAVIEKARALYKLWSGELQDADEEAAEKATVELMRAVEVLDQGTEEGVSPSQFDN